MMRGDGASDARLAILLGMYHTGALSGRNLGAPGYSYDFVAKLYAPLFEQIGELAVLRDVQGELPAAVAAARRAGRHPVHVSFHPFHHAHLTDLAPNVIVPAWEFPDIPDSPFGDNPQNDWVTTANRCQRIIVGGPFTLESFGNAGITTPIDVVPVPTPRSYFDLPGWEPGMAGVLECPAFVFPQTPPAAIPFRRPAARLTGWGRRLRRLGANVYKGIIRPMLPTWLDVPVTAGCNAALQALATHSAGYQTVDRVALEGVVFTSIFSPTDGRKNWEDLMSAFLMALGDEQDATLVLKLITSSPSAVHAVLRHYATLGIPHRCKLVITAGFLSDAQLLELARVSAYYVTTTRAEGNCLPLMNYLAAGRPGISPAHTAIADYFDEGTGLVLSSHPEPCCWPQDPTGRYTTTWHRLVWPSIVTQLRSAYELAKSGSAAYDRLARGARQRLRGWAHPDVVYERLRQSLSAVYEPAPAARYSTRAA